MMIASFVLLTTNSSPAWNISNRTTLGSTTKVIQRVKFLSQNSDTGVTITVAFDDTPGLEDTTFEDWKANAALMSRYKEQYFRSGTYPNIILLVAAWDSITPDAHNDPHHFTSAVGTTMHNLFSSGLVDERRPNVVIVVTKSMSFWDQFDGFDTTEEKDTQRKIAASIRRAVITDLQRKAFPGLPQWPIVFIENGGGLNLFEAICTVIENPGPNKSVDFAGSQALGVLSGANFTSHATTEILVQGPSEPVMAGRGNDFIAASFTSSAGKNPRTGGLLFGGHL
ncbi:hypothetical protein DFH09DRAFT_1152039, partial [Mycena vulgaris]